MIESVEIGSLEGEEALKRFPAEDGEPMAAKIRRETVPFWVPVAWLGVLFCSLAWWSWQRWTDVVFDFGEQLYVAWRLYLGEALYLDVYSHNGPLSHYLNALWFALFGVSIKTLVFCNLVVLAVFCWMIYSLIRGLFGRWVAMVSCSVFLCVFAFSQYGDIANFNYVTPYDHSSTHGLMLSVAMILCLKRALFSESVGWGVAAGFFLGLVFLTKAENFVAAAAAVGMGACVVLVSGQGSWAGKFRVGGGLLFGALVPALGFFFFLTAQMPSSLALKGVLGNWAIMIDALDFYTGKTEVPEDAFPGDYYIHGMGMDDIRGNLTLALTMLTGILVFCGLTIGLERFVPERVKSRPWLLGIGLSFFLVLVWRRYAVPWHDVARALPFTSALAAIGFGWACLRHRRDPERFARWGTVSVWATLSVFLLLKMVLFVRVYHYGFVLAVPASLLLVAVILHLGPAFFARRTRGGGLARALGVAVVGAATVFFLRATNDLYRHRDFQVGGPGDEILEANPGHSVRGIAVKTVMKRLREVMPDDATLMVVPQGVSINFWLRRENPTGHLSYLGATASVLESVKQNPPDYVAWIPINHDEHGVGRFGDDPRNGLRLIEWVNQNYQLVDPIDAIPFQEEGMGIILGSRVDSLQ